AATVAAGPFFNFALTLIIFFVMILIRGIETEPPTIGTMKPLPQAASDLREGDTILAIGGQPITRFADFDSALEKLPAEPVLEYKVRRDGQEIAIPGPYPYPPRVEELMPGLVAAENGMKVGDVVTHVDAKPIASFAELQAATKAAGDNAMKLTVWREGQVFDVEIAPRVADALKSDGGFETKRMLGIYGTFAFEPATRAAGVGEAASLSGRQTWGVVTTSLSGLYHIVAGKISTCNLSGPVRMATFVGDAARGGVETFFWRLAAISTAIGLLNLFPIPVLDGGHLVFHAYEAITRRPPSERAMRLLMSFGLFFILSVMIFALSNDLFCP
ncbi:MAG: RIP metalloprotease RseP, partial [Paracoccaceae bacterium]